MTGLELTGGLGVWTGLVLAGVAALSALLAGALLAARRAGLRRRILAGLFYALVAGALVLAMLGPQAVTSRTRETRPRVAVLVDRSGSMLERDLPGGAPRYELAKRLLAEGSALRGELQRRAAPLYLEFDSDSRTLEPSALGGAPQGRCTDLVRSLGTAMDWRGVGPLAGVILFTDGRVTRGPALALRKAEIVRRGVPIWVVGTGDPASSARARLAIASLEVPESAVVGEAVDIETTVGAERLEGGSVKVRLLVDGEEIADRSIAVKTGSARLPVRFNYLTRKLGVRRITVVASSTPAGAVPAARSSRYLVVKGRPLRALYAEGRLGWGYRSMAAALSSAPRSSLDLWTGFVESRGTTGDSRLDLAARLRGLDVLVLGDVSAARMDRKDLAALARAIREDGLGLIFMASPKASAGYAGTPLEPLLPVKLKYGQVAVEKRRISPPAGGKRSKVLRLDRKGAEDHRLWASLPATRGAWKPGQLRDGAQVLLRAGGDPLLVSRVAGRGRVAVVAWPDHWRWARSGATGAEAHRRFFARLAQWVAGREEAGTGRLALAMTRYRISPGEEVSLLARLLKAPPDGSRMLMTAELSRVLSDEQTELRVAPVGGGLHRVTIRGGAPGQYRVVVRAGTTVSKWAEGELFFSVEGEAFETENPAPDFTALRALADESGGVFLGPAESDRLRSIVAAKLPPASTRTRRARRSLWDRPPIMIASLLAACCAWLLLRRVPGNAEEEAEG